MVVNIGMIKEKRYADVLAEINAVKAACAGRLLKVIVETCLLTEEEKVKMCEVVSASGAEYIKTSTGFSTGGATRADVALFAANVSGGTLIKAAGGIASLADAEDFIALGASRLGTSRIIKQIKKAEENENGKISDTSY
jgi:deoxyribose-phosphate aldolase